MYHAHETGWLDAGAFICVLLFIALAALAHYGKWKPRNPVFFAVIGLAMLQLSLVGWLHARDKEGLRQELRGISALTASNLVVRSDGNRSSNLSTAEIRLLFDELQRIESIPAHHSHPTGSHQVTFQAGGSAYAYEVGRDSERMNEYWVFEVARPGTPRREIGRIVSPTLGELLDRLTNGSQVQAGHPGNR